MTPSTKLEEIKSGFKEKADPESQNVMGLAARYIVRPDGIIHHAHVDTDHMRRPESK